MTGTKVYATLPWAPTPEQWVDVIEKPESCRKSLDGTQVVLKWFENAGPGRPDRPAYIHEGLPVSMEGVTRYTHAEVLAIMQTAEWTTPMSEPE